MNKTVSATQARKDFFQLLKFAGKPGASVTIIREGDTPLIIMSQGEFEGWQETMELMSDPELMKDIREALAEKENIPWKKVKQELDL